MTKIEWATLGLERGETWNPIRARNRAGKTGWFCEKVSPACDHCYAERLNMKAGSTGGTGLPFKPGHRQNGDIEVYLDEAALLKPLRWRAPRGVFVCSMTDLFGRWVPDEWIDRIFAVMALCPQHRFAVLTKRPARMRVWFATSGQSFPDATRDDEISATAFSIVGDISTGRSELTHTDEECCLNGRWPLPNVWIGTTVEYQQRANERIPHLLATPAAVRFVRVEPMLGPVELRRIELIPTKYDDRGNVKRSGIRIDALSGKCLESGLDFHSDWDGEGSPPTTAAPCIDWVICGGESGPGARPMHPDWPRSLRNQCVAAGVPFFFKQFGEFAFEGQINPATGRSWVWPLDAEGEQRVGLRRAGRLLDGREHDEFPS